MFSQIKSIITKFYLCF